MYRNMARQVHQLQSRQLRTAVRQRMAAARDRSNTSDRLTLALGALEELEDRLRQRLPQGTSSSSGVPTVEASADTTASLPKSSVGVGAYSAARLNGMAERLPREALSLRRELEDVRMSQHKAVQELRDVLARPQDWSASGSGRDAAAATSALPGLTRCCVDVLTSGPSAGPAEDSWAGEEAAFLEASAPLVVGSLPPPPAPLAVPPVCPTVTDRVEEAEDRAALHRLATYLEAMGRRFIPLSPPPDDGAGKVQAVPPSPRSTTSHQSTAAASLTEGASISTWSASSRRTANGIPPAEGASSIGGGDADAEDLHHSRWLLSLRSPATPAEEDVASTPATNGQCGHGPQEALLEKRAQELADQNEVLHRELQSKQIANRLCEAKAREEAAQAAEANRLAERGQQLQSEVDRLRQEKQDLEKEFDLAAGRATMLDSELETERASEQQLWALAARSTVMDEPCPTSSSALEPLPSPSTRELEWLDSLRVELVDVYEALARRGFRLKELAALRRRCRCARAESAQLRTKAVSEPTTRPSPSSELQAASPHSLPQSGHTVDLSGKAHQQALEIADLRERIRQIALRAGGV